MDLATFEQLVQSIVTDARVLCDRYNIEQTAPVNYACVFTRTSEEYDTFCKLARQLGPIVETTKTGPVFYTTPINTVAGQLVLVKVRQPDAMRPERGDADFTLSDYAQFKKAHLGKPGFKLIERTTMEMLQLADPDFPVLAYFSYPTLAEVLKMDLS